MAYRYDYRNDYKNMNVEQLKKALDYALDKLLIIFNDDYDNAKWSKRVSYLKARIAKLEGKEKLIYQK